MLIGLNTADGSIIQQIDLSTMVSATPGQTLLQVDDMAESNGELSVLVGIGAGERSQRRHWAGRGRGGSKALCVYGWGKA